MESQREGVRPGRPAVGTGEGLDALGGAGSLLGHPAAVPAVPLGRDGLLGHQHRAADGALGAVREARLRAGGRLAGDGYGGVVRGLGYGLRAGSAATCASEGPDALRSAGGGLGHGAVVPGVARGGEGDLLHVGAAGADPIGVTRLGAGGRLVHPLHVVVAQGGDRFGVHLAAIRTYPGDRPCIGTGCLLPALRITMVPVAGERAGALIVGRVREGVDRRHDDEQHTQCQHQHPLCVHVRPSFMVLRKQKRPETWVSGRRKNTIRKNLFFV